MAAPQEETMLSRCEVPIIDLAHIVAGTDGCPMKSVVRRIGQQLFAALNGKGLAMLVNHGIAEEKLKAVYADLDNFCALPEGCQAQYLRNPVSNHGYMRPGMEQFDSTKKELRHSYNITSLSAAAFPAQDEVPEFPQHAVPLAHELTNLSRVLLQALAYALGLPPATLLGCHAGMLRSDGCNASSMRLLYYPPVPPEDEPQRDVRDAAYTRCGAHADRCTFTLLAQDSEGGLEVKLHGSEKWQAVGHLPGAILVQTGELLASWTTNLLPALMHRVVVPSGAYARARARHCVAFFCHPDHDATLPQLPQLPILAPTPAPVFTPHTHLSLHHRLLNAAHHLQKRFRETYA